MDKARLEELKSLKEDIQTKLKGKKFNTLATKDKDLLLETMAKMLGIIED